jgi:hypothetical protein
MASIILEGELPDTMPTREDGNPFPFAMAYQDRAVLADTRTELVADLIEGYAEIPDTEEGNADALVARFETGVHVADQFQQIIAAQHVEEGRFDTKVESEDTLTAIFTPRREKLGEIAPWDHVVPLVLISTDYAPFTEVPAPEGNIRWVNPYTETTFLDTMAELGVIELFVNESETV